METSPLPVNGWQFDLCSALMAIETLGFFSVSYLLLHGAFVDDGHTRGPATLSPIAERLTSKPYHHLYQFLRKLTSGHSVMCKKLASVSVIRCTIWALVKADGKGGTCAHQSCTITPKCGVFFFYFVDNQRGFQLKQ